MYTCLRLYVCGISVFWQTLIDVVSKVLDISNNQFEGANSNTEESPGTSLLETLDKFALNAYNVSVGSIESNNTSKLVHVHHCCTRVFFFGEGEPPMRIRGVFQSHKTSIVMMSKQGFMPFLVLPLIG